MPSRDSRRFTLISAPSQRVTQEHWSDTDHPCIKRSDFLPARWNRLHGRHKKGRESVREYSSPCIDMRNGNALNSADSDVGRPPRYSVAGHRLPGFGVGSGDRPSNQLAEHIGGYLSAGRAPAAVAEPRPLAGRSGPTGSPPAAPAWVRPATVIVLLIDRFRTEAILAAGNPHDPSLPDR
jgi:hypothetical protein